MSMREGKALGASGWTLFALTAANIGAFPIYSFAFAAWSSSLGNHATDLAVFAIALLVAGWKLRFWLGAVMQTAATAGCVASAAHAGISLSDAVRAVAVCVGLAAVVATAGWLAGTIYHRALRNRSGLS